MWQISPTVVRRGSAKSLTRALSCADATVETCSRLPDVLVSLAEGPPGRADLARRRAITLQAGSHTGGPGTRSGPLLAIAAGQAARNGLCRPPGSNPPPPRDAETTSSAELSTRRRLRGESPGWPPCPASSQGLAVAEGVLHPPRPGPIVAALRGDTTPSRGACDREVCGSGRLEEALKLAGDEPHPIVALMLACGDLSASVATFFSRSPRLTRDLEGRAARRTRPDAGA